MTIETVITLVAVVGSVLMTIRSMRVDTADIAHKYEQMLHSCLDDCQEKSRGIRLLTKQIKRAGLEPDWPNGKEDRT